jgi:O-antigen/teichoic acid export membrane protein
MMSAEDFGSLDAIILFSTLAGLVIPFGISSGLARYYSECKTKAEKIALSSTVLNFTIFSSIVVLCLAFWLPDSVKASILYSNDSELWLTISILIFLNCILYQLQNLLRWQLEIKKYSYVSISVAVVTAGCSIFFLFAVDNSYKSILFGQIVGVLFGVVISLKFAKQVLQITFSLSALKKVLLYSTPLVPAILFEFLAINADRITIRYLLEESELGSYGVIYRIASLILIINLAFTNAFGPVIINNYKKQAATSDTEFIIRVFIILQCTILLALNGFQYHIISIFSGDNYYHASGLLPLIGISIALQSSYLLFPGIEIGYRTKLASVLQFMWAILSLSFCFIGVRYFGIYGAPISIALASSLYIASRVYFGQRHYFIPFEIKNLVYIILAVFFLNIFLSILMKSHNDISNFIDFVILLIIIILSSIFIAAVGLKSHELIRITTFLRNGLGRG